MASGPSQGGLFGPLDAPPKRPGSISTVEPYPAKDDVRDLANALPSQIQLGTSSWMFPGWRGLIYAQNAPQKLLSRLGLGAYSQHPLLGSVGIDRTFYAPIATQDFHDYAALVPQSFRFLVKAWSEVTSPFLRSKPGKNARYLSVDTAIDSVLTPAFEGLGDKLGPLLFQFPPQGTAITSKPETFADALHQFFSRLPKGVDYTVELRDSSLLTERYVEAITAGGARHCYCVHPRMPSIEQQLELAPVKTANKGPIAVRWMLHAGRSYEEAKEHYQPFNKMVDEDPGSRRAIAKLATDAIAMDVAMTVIVNNKAEGSAPCSVHALAQEIVAIAQNTRSTTETF